MVSFLGSTFDFGGTHVFNYSCGTRITVAKVTVIIVRYSTWVLNLEVSFSFHLGYVAAYLKLINLLEVLNRQQHS